MEAVGGRIRAPTTHRAVDEEEGRMPLADTIMFAVQAGVQLYGSARQSYVDRYTAAGDVS